MTDVNLEEMRTEIRPGQEEMRSRVSAIEEKLDAAIHSMRAWRKETTACQDAMEANLEKMKATDLTGNPVEMEYESEYRKVPKETGQRTEEAA
jgi:hypothetical protein